MRKYDRSIVAAGHPLVSQAAGEILEAGGNAFDAVVAAGFASAVVEPALTSLGGGGFMLGHVEKSGQDIFFDFFVDTPGKGSKLNKPDDFYAVTVDFSGASQDFHIGSGSVAVPGVLKGLLHSHKRLGRMSLKDVLEPARQYILGHHLHEQQGHFLTLLHPILTRNERGRRVYAPRGIPLGPGDLLVNLEASVFLEQLVEDRGENFYRGELAAQIALEMREKGGLLTREDLAGYTVYERKPLNIPCWSGHFLTPSEPSMGGSLIGLAISLRSGMEMAEKPKWCSAEHLLGSVGLMQEVERLRDIGVTNPERLKQFCDGVEIKESLDHIRLFPRGTTHVSVADSWGNCAAMTCSNGEGSGYVVPDCGIMLNNMMGEDDLHPQGFHSTPPGKRVFSMMSPSLFLRDGSVELVIGSGGSKRIRTAIVQVLDHVVGFERSLTEAVAAPRLHLDKGVLQVEPGLDEQVVERLRSVIDLNLWPQKDVYFGGVHAVIPGKDGVGDSRRGGAVATILHPEA
mgnify:CR=1 FL=1